MQSAELSRRSVSGGPPRQGPVRPLAPLRRGFLHQQSFVAGSPLIGVRGIVNRQFLHRLIVEVYFVWRQCRCGQRRGRQKVRGRGWEHGGSDRVGNGDDEERRSNEDE